MGHLPQPLEGCWYVDLHWDPQSRERTATGNLLYQAKTYGQKLGEFWAAEELGRRLAQGVEVARVSGRFPLRTVDAVVSVPANPPKIPYNLPDILAQHVSSALGVPFLSGAVIKTMRATQAKRGSAAETHAFEATFDFRGKTVLIVDDVVHTGRTLDAVGKSLRAARVGPIGGYVATRAKKGMTFYGLLGAVVGERPVVAGVFAS